MIIIIPVVFSVGPVAGRRVVIFLPEQILVVRPGILDCAYSLTNINKQSPCIFHYINIKYCSKDCSLLSRISLLSSLWLNLFDQNYSKKNYCEILKFKITLLIVAFLFMSTLI